MQRRGVAARRTQRSAGPWRRGNRAPPGPAGRGSSFSPVSLIYHIATSGDWDRARREGQYTTSTIGKTLADEGFIHASGPGQVTGVANMFYAGVADELIVLGIDPGRVRAEIRYEDVPGAAEPFPHIYGPLNADAVVATWPLPAGPDGEFSFHPEP